MADIQQQIGERAQADAGRDFPGLTFREQREAYEAAVPLARVGDVITEGPIPANVARVHDRTGGMHERDDENRWHLRGIGEDLSPWSAGDLLDHGPLTVTAVREPEPAAVEAIATTMVGGAKVPVYAEPPTPAAEPQPEADLRGLVMQYGDEREDGGLAGEHAGAAEIQHHADLAAALFARIEAEVQRLPDDDLRALLLPIWQEWAFSPDEPDNAALARWASAMVENERRERHGAKRSFARIEELRAEIERLKAAAPGRTEQARDCLGQPFWQHEFCGEVYSDQKDHEQFCDPGGPWRPLLVATDAPQQDGPVVLTLPADTAALIGGKTQRRYLPVDFPYAWKCSDTDLGLQLGEIFADEDGSVTVEMAPPREPRTWRPVDTAEYRLKVRGSSGNLYAFTGGNQQTGYLAHVDRIGDDLFGCWLSLGALREVDGPLTEVFDDEAGTR